MGYKMKTRSADCPVPQLLASVGVGALGAVSCLPPHVEALRGFLWMVVRIAEQSLFTGETVSSGLRWDGRTAPSPGCRPTQLPWRKGS